ncbi:hypothetical protein [Streptomyces olivochromogenes]|uniref:hypothetical protein n=1 Tax=Streptomyces olivochromogenes TaxID=1963 RepID=UPI001F30045E|nr:hypothetical protein [Streptomyces olivochromogenes]MCF3130991.1 hypothetical protein [Streptomyces olivochromogenes]
MKLTAVWARGGTATSIEWAASPRFKRLVTAHELHLFFAPTREEAAWAAERMDSDGHQRAVAGADVVWVVEGFGGFAGQYEQIDKVSAHHDDFWEVLLYGQLGRGRSVVSDLAEKLEFTATSEDGRVLRALAHVRRYESARGEYSSALGENVKPVDISFATQNWRKAVLDKTRPGQFVPKHFEAVDVAVAVTSG